MNHVFGLIDYCREVAERRQMCPFTAKADRASHVRYPSPEVTKVLRQHSNSGETDAANAMLKNALAGKILPGGCAPKATEVARSVEIRGVNESVIRVGALTL